MAASLRKIMFLADAYENPYAGTEGQLYELIAGLQDRGIEVTLALLRPSAYIEENGFPCPVQVLGIGSLASLAALRAMARFASATKQAGFELVHIFFNDSSLIAPLFLRRAGLKTIISRRDMGFWYTPTRKLILRLNSLLVNAAVTNSEAVKGETAASEWIPKSRIHVIHNGYKQSGILAQPNVDINSDLGSEAAKRVIIVANVRPIKRVHDLIDAAALLRDKDISYLVVGGGDLNALKARAEHKGVSDKFRLLGRRADVPALLVNSHIAVLCSESEGFSNALIEYQMAGKPVICTRAGGNPEIIEHGRNGFLYEVGDVNRLAELIARLVDDPAEAVALGETGRRLVQDRFGLPRMVSAHIDLYVRLLDTSGRRTVETEVTERSSR
jgi:glycosyltransferase involved in cell wall biosynthesis